MKSNWRITFLGNEILIINSKIDIDYFFKNYFKILKIANPIIVLENPNGEELTFGLFENFGFLNFVGITQDPPYYSSVNTEVRSNAIIDFYCGETTEIPERNCLSIDKVLMVVKEFYNTNKLSNKIKWEED